MIVVVGWMNRGVSGWLQLIDRFDTVCTNIRKKHGMVIGGLTYILNSAAILFFKSLIH